MCVWTDEIGDDTLNKTLEADIINLRDQTHSIIFFMTIQPVKQPVVTAGSKTFSYYTTASYHRPAGRVKKQAGSQNATNLENLPPAADGPADVNNGDDDDLPSKKRYAFSQWESRFSNIGYVMDITNDPDVIPKTIEIMKKNALCNKN